MDCVSKVIFLFPNAISDYTLSNLTHVTITLLLGTAYIKTAAATQKASSSAAASSLSAYCQSGCWCSRCLDSCHYSAACGSTASYHETDKTFDRCRNDSVC